ncbi:MAG: energy-coupling factor transporter ATPase [Ruminococcaceae bacterium]|nr:energy-coupling factor transporter ATPase [Oscillospiraceae bacterium]
MPNIISAEKVRFGYQKENNEFNLVLKDISLEIPQGQFLAVLGHNGSGKSTFAKHLNAILLPQGGTVTVCGLNTADEDKLYDIRQQVGMVFQNPDNQIVATIVEEDVAFGPENMGVEPSEIRTRVDEALKDVGMDEYKTHAPHQLSGGQKQRIAIAGIIAMRPRCIVLDEPTAMLDPRGRSEVIWTVKRLNSELGITVVLITHYMEEAAQCDRVVVMNDGEVLLDDTPRRVFSHVEQLKSVGLDVPQATELCWQLRKNGFDLPDDILTEDECVEAISALLEAKK